MAEIEELAEYVVVHPDDYARRWTLAKKLYMAWEYGAALNHLLFLKKNWSRKLNVLRYLAATYYRLGRYDESIEELKSITQLWPSEAAVWEQLARVYEVAGKNSEAANTWEQVLKLQPSHPIAARAMQRLRSSSNDYRRDDLRLRDSDSGIDMSPYRICNKCGAQNSEEFDRCWQCHASLRSGMSELDASAAPGPLPGNRWMVTFFGGIATVAILSLDVYIAFVHAREIQESSPIASVYDALADALLVPRLVASVTLLAAWPFALWMGFRLMRLRPLNWSSAFYISLFLSALTFLAMWAPIRWLPLASVVPAAASLMAIVAMRATTFWRSVGIWLIHGTVPIASAAAMFYAVAGVQPLTEFPAIISYEASLSAVKLPLRFPLFADVAPAACGVRWQSTGSYWLDANGNRMELEFIPENPEDKLDIEIKYGKTAIANIMSPPYRITLPVEPETVYEIWVHGDDKVRFHSVCRGILQPFVTR